MRLPQALFQNRLSTWSSSARFGSLCKAWERATVWIPDPTGGETVMDAFDLRNLAVTTLRWSASLQAPGSLGRASTDALLDKLSMPDVEIVPGGDGGRGLDDLRRFALATASLNLERHLAPGSASPLVVATKLSSTTDAYPFLMSRTVSHAQILRAVGNTAHMDSGDLGDMVRRLCLRLEEDIPAMAA